MATHCHNGQVMPVASLHEIADMLTLALDATESASGYPQHIREARSYCRRALRQTERLMGGLQ
ncbi:hypothetical protein [Pseudogemmobacter bohemicus]|uniref:hypothetical protein n=1 Tax=Pseudogemmobacter bohemicus TaxID=2250708 RepID=UPI000DD3A66B|nr:hypothetical protein [Pseudogemmobacter bohemicus]